MVMPLLKRYLMALNHYKWAGLAGFLGVLGASGFVAIQPPPPDEYVSEGILVQNAPVVSFTATGVELQQEGQGIITQDFLLSDILLEQVSQQLAQQGVELTPRELRQQTKINIEANENQLQRVNVTFTSENSEEAEAALPVMFEGMIELSRITNRSRLRTIIEALNERLPEVERELREAEQALEEYDRVEGPAIQAALDGSLLNAITGSQSQRRQNLITLAGIEGQMKSLQSQLGLTPDQAYASSALSADPIIAQLRAQINQAETQLQLLSRELRPAHPQIVELRSNLQSYERLLRQRAQEVISGGQLTDLPSTEAIRLNSNLDPARAELANQLVALKIERDALIRQQQVLAQAEVQLREQYANIPNKQLERDRLAQQVALKRALYDQIQAKLIDARAAEAETVSSLTVASPPATERVEASARNPLTVLAIGGFLGLVVGGGLVFLLDMMDSTVRTYEDLEKLFEEQEVPLLALVPAIPTRSSRTPPLILAEDSAYGDLYERLRSNLQLSGAALDGGRAPQTILLTSTRDSEGKTITAFNLGIAAARAGRRTLIIEADLRSPSQSKLLGITPDEQAAIEPLRYYGGHLSDPIQMVPSVENLYISPSAGPQRNAAAIIDSSEMERFLEVAKARFDLIILDSPHLSSSNDAMLLETKTDGMVIVARPGFTEKPVLSAALEELEETEDIQLFGAVINGADIPVQAAQSQTEEAAPRSPVEPEEEGYTAKDAPVMTPVDF